MTMKHRTHTPSPTTVRVGFAAGSNGNGVAYLAIPEQRASQGARSFTTPLRVAFRCSPMAGLHGRDVAYAALTAVANDLLARGLRAAVFLVGDQTLANDLNERRAIPPALTMPYVTLRCRLNRFESASVDAEQSPLLTDLIVRARAEAALLAA